jgi:hypothetical protein
MFDQIRFGWLLVLGCLLWSACGGGVTTTGRNIKEYMPLDQDEYWLYEKTDDTDGLLYEVRSLGEETINGETLTVFAWKYGDIQALTEDNLGPNELFFMETYWSKSEGGLYFHGSDDAEGVSVLEPWATLVYEFPITFGTVNAWEGDIAESGSDGHSWTAEFVAMEEVQTNSTTSGYNAMHIRFVEINDASPFTGDYWLGPDTGIVQFVLDDDPEVTWSLKQNTPPS